MLLTRIDHVDSNYLRGIAILAIMLHNYFHILEGAPGENEFSFSTDTTYTYLYNLINAPSDFIKQSFSFLGHYAVQIFVFLSGYGLARKYTQGTDFSYSTFIKERFRKVYPVLFFAVTLLFLYKAGVTFLFPTKTMDLSTFAYEALMKLTLISNFIPGEALSISGPWWFFSLIFQLYLFAPFLLRIRQHKYLLAFIIIPWLVQFLLITYFPKSMPYWRVNILGHLPEFVLGIYLVRLNAQKGLSPLLIFALLSIFIAGSFNQYLWIVSFATVPLLTLVVYTSASPSTHCLTSRVFTFFGKNSIYFFAVHGLCRAPFVPWGNQSTLWSIIAALAYMATVVIITMLFKFVVQSLNTWIIFIWQSTFSKKVNT